VHLRVLRRAPVQSRGQPVAATTRLLLQLQNYTYKTTATLYYFLLLYYHNTTTRVNPNTILLQHNHRGTLATTRLLLDY